MTLRRAITQSFSAIYYKSFYHSGIYNARYFAQIRPLSHFSCNMSHTFHRLSNGTPMSSLTQRPHKKKQCVTTLLFQNVICV